MSMSSISALFGLDETGADATFDPAALEGTLDSIIAGHRTRMGAGEVPTQDSPDAAPNAAGDVQDPGAGLDLGAGVPAPVVEPPAAPVVADDPFAAFDAERRQELMILARSLDDPERATEIRRAYLGVREQAAATPQAPPEPQLPEHITPQSFEADLWRQNQTLSRQIEEIRAAQSQTTEQTALERARQAANSASQRFIARYGNALSRAEIEAVHKVAGNRALPDAMIRSNGGDVEKGMYDALEFVLRSTDTLLGRVLTGPSPAALAAAAAPAQPAVQTPILGRTAEAMDNARLLTALSTGANPVGAPPPRAPLEVDHSGGGRMTEQSRQRLISEVVGQMRQEG